MAYTVLQLLNLIRQIPETDCWEFKGNLDRSGYGRMYVDNKEVKAHRVFYEVCVGPVPEGKYLQHHLPLSKCIGPACCNPQHVQPGNSPHTKPQVEAEQPKCKTCPQGHLMTPENTVTERRNGQRRAFQLSAFDWHCLGGNL